MKRFHIRNRLIFLLAALFVALTGGTASASMALSECKDVSDLATVEFDDTLIVTLFSDRNQRVCRFSVALPPNLSSFADPGLAATYNAIGVLGTIRSEFKVGTQEQADALRLKFAPVLSDALVRPLTEGNLRTEKAAPLIEAIQTAEGQNLIERCVSEALPRRQTFADEQRLISCGTIGERGFGIQARVEDLSFSLLFPAY
ncbi:hypothetical protein CN059_31015 [Sinorhizobium medicae]|uniref:hypothetical protein n=1 Tax=Sinorhizobium medicae TaxID=110321 RepID=UPI000C7D49B1|nr:hypothetical protein [Sinorhizobium medicae]PLU44384.1 hypothetical protein BMJ25_25565 [Sinorhizobium medicae]RVQ39623.1 hypothetical protein CN059_31015 [Sinorhizobium medicae]